MKLIKITIKILKKIKFLIPNLFFKLKTFFKKGNIKWLGGAYGGFYVDISKINKDSVVYSFGIGEDISFDKELINKTKTVIYGFDPTPKSIKWVNKNKIENFNFFDFGIGDKNKEMKMYLPKNKDHVSGSVIKNNNLSNDSVNIKIRTLDFIMNKLNHNYIDLLKLDVEGSEFDVLNEILNKNINVNQIVVEFHDRFFKNGKEMRKKIIKKLKNKGYTLFAVSSSFEEFSFIKKN
jgi:FkbM family methyltransferase